MQFIAPEAIASFNMDGVDYHPDDKGLFKIEHPDHVKLAQMHGAVPYVPETDDIDEKTRDVNRNFRDHAAKDSRIAELEAMLAEARANASQGATATDGPREVVSGPGDTSLAPGGGGVIPPGSHTTSAQPQGQAGDNLDQEEKRLDALLASKPDTDNYDAMKAWLKDVGVAVPGNVSKSKAAEIVEETVKDLNEGKKKAPEAREAAKGTSTGADTAPTA